MTHDEKRVILKSNCLCMNCMRSGHFVKNCKSLHKCHVCQKPHHTLLHVEKTDSPSDSLNVSSNTVMKIRANALLMTCYVKVKSPEGSVITARALLDSASSASFVTERLARALNLPRSRQKTNISGVTGITTTTPLQSVASFSIITTIPPGETIDVVAIVSPIVTCDLPLSPVSFDLSWNHLSDIPLADPDFASPGRVDILLGVEVFVAVLLNGRRCGPPGSPVAFQTKLGWVLAGNTNVPSTESTIVSHHTHHVAGDDLLRKFWELEENPSEDLVLTPEEAGVVKHFETEHIWSKSGRFIVPLPKKPDSKPLGESRMQAVRRYTQFERSLHSKGLFPEVKAAIDEYFDMGHAEPVPESDLDKPTQQVFYLPIHAVMKSSSTTTKVRAVFDASAKTSTGVSLNDNLLVGPTVHSSLVDVLLRFHFHRIALIADVSRMYRAIELISEDKDLHRFVWRSSPEEVLKDYRMTRITFILHAGPLLVAASLSSQYHFIGGKKSIRSITRSCVICRRTSLRTESPLMGQLPKERVTPDSVFDRVGLDYAGPIYIKHGYVRKPVVIKAYICVFVSLSVKAVHIELVSDLTSESFIACLRRFIARRGKPTLMWSDYGTNFVGAARQIKELYDFLSQTKTSELVSDFCTTQRAPRFGGLWEAAIKSLKKHLSRIVGTVKLTFEEMTTVLTQIEACLNSRPLTRLPCDDDDGIQVLTPGHFLIGRPLVALANPKFKHQSLTLLKRWHLCQLLVKHLWDRWSTEYLSAMQRVTKWLSPSTKISVGDVVIAREDNTTPTHWPLARIIKTHPGKDGIVRVLTIRASSGREYTRPVVKIVPILYVKDN